MAFCRNETKNAYMVLVEKPEGKTPLEDQDIGGRKILKWIEWGGMD
jgi:hypothetical protein